MNQFYLACIASEEVRDMVIAHRVLHGGRVEQLCYLTTAATAWLLTGGIDRVPSFSGVRRERGTGPSNADRAIAYGYSDDDEGFDEDHTLIALVRGGRTIIMDSCLAEGRALTLRVVEAVPPPPPGQSARFVVVL